MCTFLLENDALWNMGLVHFGICELGQFRSKNISVGAPRELIYCRFDFMFVFATGSYASEDERFTDYLPYNI